MNKTTDLGVQTDSTLKRLEKFEKNWHEFKIIMLILIAISIIGTQIYTYHRLLENNDKNHRLLECSVQAFSSGNYKNIGNVINGCVEANK